MIKRLATIFIAIAAFASLSTPAKAQRSDDAVIAYVKQGVAAGKSQDAMIQELALRGVTREQAERLKERMQKEQAGTSAVRTAGAQERARRTDDAVLGTDQAEAEIILSEVEETSGPQVFGRNIFTNRNLTFTPSANLPTPAEYKLGPGDEVIIDIWGTNQATIRQTISPDGTINIPDVGLVSLNGMTVKAADSYLRKKLGQIYSVDGADAKSEIKLTLGNIRTIQVNVLGEAAIPGTYNISSLSNIYHALHFNISKVGISCC